MHFFLLQLNNCLYSAIIFSQGTELNSKDFEIVTKNIHILITFFLFTVPTKEKKNNNIERQSAY